MPIPYFQGIAAVVASVFVHVVIAPHFGRELAWLFTAAAISIGTASVVLYRSRIAKNYEWYKKTYPQHVAPDGRIKCFNCGSTRIHAHKRMNHSYVRDHFCTQCGTTLYHSPE